MEPETAPEAERRSALEAAFSGHYLALLRLAILLTGHQTRGEDLVQEAFVRVADRVGQLTASEVRPYLRTVLLNVWRNEQRHDRVRARREGAERASAAVEGQEGRVEMWDLIVRLPARQRACVVLRFYEDLSIEETARLLKCSPGTVKSQTSRAIDRLRREVR